LGSLYITSQLLPSRWRKVVYLFEVAALTRMLTGMARVWENRPSQQRDDRMSKNEKRQALAERFFVEILGTMGYMAFLHLGQDVVDKVYTGIRKPKIPSFSEWERTCPEKFNALQLKLGKLGLTVQQFDEKIKELYLNQSNKPSGLLHRVLYEHDMPLKNRDSKLIDKAGKEIPKGGKPVMVAEKATLARLQEKITECATPSLDPDKVKKDFQKIVTGTDGLLVDLEKFASQNNKWAAGAILFGVSLSALVGGTVTQWMNDRMVAPQAKNWLGKHFANDSVKPALTQKINQTLASVGNLKFPPASAFLSQGKNFVPSPPTPAAQPPNPFNFSQLGAPQPIAPVYLPNPKMQPPATAFGARTLPRPYTTPLPSYSGPRFGGGL
jgi:hypothetical protein